MGWERYGKKRCVCIEKWTKCAGSDVQAATAAAAATATTTTTTTTTTPPIIIIIIIKVVPLLFD
jgi:hypothetical protein